MTLPGEAEGNGSKPHGRAVGIRAEILTQTSLTRSRSADQYRFLRRLSFYMGEWQAGYQSRISPPFRVLRFNSRSPASHSRCHVFSRCKRSSCCSRGDGCDATVELTQDGNPKRHLISSSFHISLRKKILLRNVRLVARRLL
jgi:hypothetical protein